MLRIASLCLVWAFAVLVAPAQASAAVERYGNITLDLQPQSGQPPTHLCVVSEAQGPRTRKLLWDHLDTNPSPDRAGALTWRLKPSAWGGPPEDADRGTCGESPVTDCRPRVTLPAGLGKGSNLYVACSADSLMTDGGLAQDPRVLVVFMEHLGGSPPRVDSVRLTGGVATLGILADLSRVVVTARSLGGHYLPHTRSYRELDRVSNDKLVVLPVAPACRWIDVILPGTPLQSADRERLAVRVHGAPIEIGACVDEMPGSEVLRILVPDPPAGLGSVDVELRSSGTEDRPPARFGGQWRGRWPTSPFELRATQLSFSWRPPACIYPEDRCPAATLANGTTCRAQVQDRTCVYQCPGNFVESVAQPLELPVGVTFEDRDPHQSWTDTLARNGQELSSYVAAAEIRLRANINRWRTDIPGNRIRRVEVFGEDGQVYGLPVTHTVAQMRVPGASCRPLNFRPVGDREYGEAVAEVRDGKLDFGRPERTARVVSYNGLLAVGGGPAWSSQSSSTPLFFSGMAQLAAQFRPRRAPASRFAPEIRLTATIGQWGLTDVSEVDADRFKSFAWARVLLGPGLVFDAFSRVAFSASFDLGTSFPIRRPEELVNERLNFIYSPSLGARFRVRRRVSIVLQTRGIFGEKSFRSSADSDMPDPSEDTLDTESAISLLISTGVVVGF